MHILRRSGSALLLLILAMPACSSPAVPALDQSTSKELSQKHATPLASYLYAVAFSGYLVSYRLPMVAGEAPAASTTVKAQGVAVHGTYLFAATNNEGAIAEFTLPLLNGAKPTLSLAIPNAGAISASNGFLYVTGQGRPGTVSAYPVPLSHGERAAATISTGAYSAAALAADSTHLYVANQGGTLSAYSLPLHTGEMPDATLQSLYEESGVAVQGTHLYLSRFDTAQVFVYALPLVSGEKPSVTLNTGYNWTGPLAATPTDLFVSDVARYAWDFPKPIHAGETASKNVEVYPQNGNLLAVQQ